MTATLTTMITLVEASVGQRDVVEGIPAGHLDGRFTHEGWDFTVVWGVKGGTVECRQGDTVFRCRATALAELAEFGARILAAGEFRWDDNPAGGVTWPKPFRWDAATATFVVDPPVEVVRVASTPRQRRKRAEWCALHAREHHGQCPLCEDDE